MGQRLDRGAKERANRIRAGVDRNGNETRWGRLNRSHNERIRTDALKRAQSDRALRRAESNAVEMAEYEDMEQQVKDTEERLSGVSSDDGMIAEMQDIINNGFADGTSARDIAAQVAGAVNHWNNINGKNDADGTIAEALDKLSGQGDDARAQEIRREVARRRLADSDGMLKAKHGAMRQYYRTQAASTAPAAGDEIWNGGEVGRDNKNRPIYEHNQWVDKLVNSNDFTAEWLAGVAPPQIEQLQKYMEDSSTSVENKRRIAQTYDDMKRISAYQGATASDYDKLEAAIYNFRNPPAP